MKRFGRGRKIAVISGIVVLICVIIGIIVQCNREKDEIEMYELEFPEADDIPLYETGIGRGRKKTHIL